MHLDTERESIYSRGMKSHRMSSTPFYRVYCTIVGRCNNRGCSNYAYYGGRGIRCEWSTFEQFRDDMIKGYEEHSARHGRSNTLIERNDNDGNYCKDNCRWATRQEQAEHKRNSVLLEFEGRVQTLTSWSREIGISRGAIKKRMKSGLSVAEALMSPKRKNQYA